MLRRPAFTLIELLLVIGIIGVLSSIVILAVNPQLQLASAQDAKRRADARTVQQALEQYLVDYGALPNAASIATNSTVMICKEGLDPGGCVRLDDDLVPTYIVALPQDPLVPDTNHSGFTVKKNALGRPSVTAAYIGTNAAGSPTDYVARLPLQDSSASTAIQAIVGVGGTLFGGDTTAAISAQGPGGALTRALEFDGVSDRISLPIQYRYSPATTLSIAFWYYHVADTLGTIGYFASGTDTGFNIAVRTTNRIGVTVEVQGATTNGGAPAGSLSVGNWYHVALTWDASAMSLNFYLNGQTVSGGTGLNVAFAGADLGSQAGNYKSSRLADFRVYDRVLSAAEVAALAVLN